ncbi:LysR family transcriptional regulator [Streptomyces acidiscabies]|uniref:LysR family transcriptional regulator n=1 Tax=Streptomyces acidiscabies TaxID=42234 RepID=UPI0038F72560
MVPPILAGHVRGGRIDAVCVRAAARLCQRVTLWSARVSPATPTRTVQRLETDLGHRLFGRGPRGVALTSEGHRFREYAVQARRRWPGWTRGTRTSPWRGFRSGSRRGWRAGR